MTDAELLNEARRGNAIAWQALYQRYLPVVWRHAQALVVGVHAAEDVTSETMLAFVQSIEQLDTEAPRVESWLHTVVHCKAADHHRKASRLREKLPTVARATAEREPQRGPSANLETTEARTRVLRILDEMPERQRIALEWKYLDALRVKEIAERLGETEKAVETVLYRARREFRRLYESNEFLQGESENQSAAERRHFTRVFKAGQPMTTKHEQPEDWAEDGPENWTDAQFAELLRSAYGSCAMRGEFIQELSQRLDEAFAASRPSTMEQLLAPSTNGHGGQFAGLTESLKAAAGDDVRLVAPAIRGGRWRRRFVGISAAALLLLSIAVWADPPAWAAMFRVLVHSIAELTIGGSGRPSRLPDDADKAPSIEQLEAVQPPAAPPETVTVREEARPISSPTPEPPAQGPESKSPTAEADPHAVADDDGWAPFAEPLSLDELPRRIDDQLTAFWLTQGIHPGGPASDAEFMRRVFLDLTGRIPTVSEVHAFLDDPSPNRRELLVDGLLEQRDHATHLAAIWREILLPDGVELSRLGGAGKFEEWLAERFAANVPYDQIVRELLLAEGRVSESGPLLFYAALKLNPEELASRTSRAFLGVRMECAQCHNHPFDSVTQRDFWGFAAFFARISRPRGKMEMASPVLRVQDNEQGEVTIPNLDEVVPPRLPLTANNLEDVPEGPSRRQQLVNWLTSPRNSQFSRATVNRVWAHLFGSGLVEPVDDMRRDNVAICPEVLDTLSRDFAASGFNLRRLLRALARTKAYQLSSGDETDDPSRAHYFAQMNIKSLTAEQLYDCITVATQPKLPASRPQDEAGLLRFADMSRQKFIEQFRTPAGQATDYQAGIPQALTLMHGGLIHSATDLETSGLLKAISAPFFTDQQRLETMFLSTLSRYPEPAEREAMLVPLSKAETEADRQRALGDLLWVLLNSAEFTFNH